MAAMVGALAAAAVKKRRDDQIGALARTFEVWRAFAGAWRLSYEEVASSPAVPRISGLAGKAELAVELGFDAEAWAYTRVIANAPAPVDAVIAASPTPHGIFDVLRTKLFGQRDLSVGDATFDAQFLLHADPAEVASSFFDDELRPLLAAWRGHQLQGLTYERGRVVLQWSGCEVDAGVLESGVGLVLRVAAWRWEREATGYR